MSDYNRLYGKPPAPAPELVVDHARQPADLDATARAELIAETAEPEQYRPYAISRGGRPMLGFAIVERNGTLHGFQYHTLRYPRHQARDGSEYLDFTADGMAVLVEGKGLAVLFRALMRHTLTELREENGRPSEDPGTCITRVHVVDPRQVEDERRTRG